MCQCWRILLLTTFASGIGAAVAAQPTTEEVEINGITMSYVEEGTGEPAVLVHGAVSDARVWDPIRAELADQHRVIAPTLRYFGTGEWPDKGENFSVATHADDVAALIEALELGPVHLVGWSYGGDVVTAVALKSPELVQSLILYEGAPWTLFPEGAEGDAAREAIGQMVGPVGAALEEGDPEKATKLLIESVFQMEPGGYESQPQELKDIQLANARTMPPFWSAPPVEVTCEMLGQLDKPTLLVHGGDSNALWVQADEAMAECLPQEEMATLPGVNHNGPVRDPAGFARLIEEFVASH